MCRPDLNYMRLDKPVVPYLDRLTGTTIGSIQDRDSSRDPGRFAFTTLCNLRQRCNSGVDMTRNEVRQSSA